MTSVIRKWGNSPALRLPTALLKEAGLSVEQRVEITVAQGRIVIRAADAVAYDLAELVGAINAGNTHDEVSFGRPVGSEAL